jgi:hypothetical protein
MQPNPAGQALSARALRVARREETCRRFAAILDARGVTRTQVALETGASQQHVSDCTNPEADANLSVADARAIVNDEVRRDLGELVMGPRFVAVRRHESPTAALDVKSAARMLRAASAAVDSMLEALADGVLDPAERRELLRRIEPLICDAEGVRTALLADDVPAPKGALRAVPK